ncbi:hypothetical protein [Nocardia sp. NBC_01329]|uniref:hypothetical protein n=1 Tax=Nocardia sp. NBC_01329 TaxID=2903594 RepID=UPI002E162F5E|nr:hypothetical protein OG405_14795 [Nocardia sp. NBC_01329]
MTTALHGTPIAALVTDLVELGRPPAAVRQTAGYTELPAPQPGKIRTPDNDPGSAGADVVNDEVVVDGDLISGPPLDDLPALCQTVVEQFAKTGAGAS